MRIAPLVRVAFPVAIALGACQSSAPTEPPPPSAEEQPPLLGPRADLVEPREGAGTVADSPGGTRGDGLAAEAGEPGRADGTATVAMEDDPGATPPPPSTTTVPPGPKAPGLEGTPGPSPALGPATAPVKVFVFSDFQCPVCRRVVEPIKHLARSYPKDVQIVFKHNALTVHGRAEPAATAAIAAMRQGKFWEFHDRVFRDQRALGDDDLERHAKDLGLDLARFRKDRDDPRTRAQIAYERALASALDAQSTPSFFVNGTKQVGWGSYEGLRQMVDAALRAAQAAAKPGLDPRDLARAATLAGNDEAKRFANLIWGAK